MKIAFSWDDGALEDQKLFELHEKYEIPAIFFIPNRNIEGKSVLSPEQIKKAESQYVSFGGHTLNHRYLTRIPIDEVKNEVYYNQKYLEDILGHSIEHFCLPGGKYNSQILAEVKQFYKTVRTADTMNFSLPKDCIVKPSIHFYPRGASSMIYNSLKHMSISEVGYLIRHINVGYFELIEELIELKSAENNDKDIALIWGHSWEINEYGLWTHLEHFMKKVKNLECINYSDLFG